MDFGDPPPRNDRPQMMAHNPFATLPVANQTIPHVPVYGQHQGAAIYRDGHSEREQALEAQLRLANE